MNILTWLTPALFALFLYGIGQGLVKKYISEVPPARFCLYFVVAKALVNIGYFLSQGSPDVFTSEQSAFVIAGIVAYVLDGLGWILYFQSIVYGPITIVGTLSAAYPATTVLFAWWFLGEILQPIQYVGVALVILGCIGLAYTPPGSDVKVKGRRWIPMAVGALIIWGLAQTTVKYSYTLEGATEVKLALLNTLGGFLTLGIYGFLYGRQKVSSGVSHSQGLRDWLHSFLPMGMMAGGDLGVIIAARYGPISIVTPLTGAYPMVTVLFASVILKEKITLFQWGSILAILAGMYLSPGAS